MRSATGVRGATSKASSLLVLGCPLLDIRESHRIAIQSCFCSENSTSSPMLGRFSELPSGLGFASAF